jgi:hypothetical protein
MPAGAALIGRSEVFPAGKTEIASTTMVKGVEDVEGV